MILRIAEKHGDVQCARLRHRWHAYPPARWTGSKDQDFAHRAILCSFMLPMIGTSQIKRSKALFIGYVLAECKTNLDKTMFQEAVATAHRNGANLTPTRSLLRPQRPCR